MEFQAESYSQALLGAFDQYSRRTCFQQKRGQRVQSFSYRWVQARALRLAYFFIQNDISDGVRVALVADNSPEWMAVYIASQLAGVVAVPLRKTYPADMLSYILKDCGARLIVADNAHDLQFLSRSQGLDESELPRCLILGKEMNTTELDVVYINHLFMAPFSLDEEAVVRQKAKDIPLDAISELRYTDEQTGLPKGAIFEQDQRMAAMMMMSEWFDLDENDSGFTMLAWNYAPSLDASIYYFLNGTTNVISSEQADELFESLQQTSPTVAVNTPYAFEHISKAILDDVAAMPHIRQEMFQWALKIGQEYQALGPASSKELRDAYARADMTFFTPLRGMLGGRINRFYSFGAPLPRESAEFMQAIGLSPINVYSLPEAGGFPAVSAENRVRYGSCGQVVPGFQIRIADDGEILVRGKTVMRGYWQWGLQAQRSLDEDGWLNTGDIGHFDADGHLYITGRKQAFIVLSTSRKVIPSIIEAALTRHELIEQAVIFGEGRPYLIALIQPNLDVLIETLPESVWNGELPSLSQAANLPQAHDLIDRCLQESNLDLDEGERIRSFVLVNEMIDMSDDNPIPASSSSRNVLSMHYAAQIAKLYPKSIQLQEKEITQVNLTPERLRELLEKESILDAWMADAGIEFLFDLAREKGIDAPSMVHICDAAAAIAQMESEEKPLSTALIVGNPGRIGRILPNSEIQLLRYDHIRRMRRVVIGLAKVVDGLVLGYAVDHHGFVRGIYKLDVPQDDESSLLLGPQFRRHAAVSRLCQAVIFFVPTGGRQVRVFSDGHLIGRYTNGKWSSENIQHVDKIVTNLSEETQVDEKLLRRILRCAFRMSEENLGAIFLLGDAGLILENSDSSEISAFAAMTSANLADLADSELINFAKQDGATLIDTQGRFRGCMILLRPSADTPAEIGPGKGARHSSAAKMSTEANCIAITVSQDGPITLYNAGKHVLSV